MAVNDQNHPQDDARECIQPPEEIGQPLEAYSQLEGEKHAHQGYAHVEDQKFDQQPPIRRQEVLADQADIGRSNEHRVEEGRHPLHPLEPVGLILRTASR